MQRLKALVCLLMFASFALTLTPSAASAAPVILQNQGLNRGLIISSEPVGQTFTAIAPELDAIAFAVSDFNPGEANLPITLRLYEGVGAGGTLLHTVVDSIAPGLNDQLWDFDFSGITVTPGEVYTFMIDAQNLRWAYTSNQHTYGAGGPIPGAVDYLGGDAIRSGAVDNKLDLRFRVTFAPTPAALPAGLVALGLLATRRRRR